MDYAAAINGISSLGLEQTSGVGLNSLTGVLTKEDNKVEGTMFDAFLSSAIDNLKTTNNFGERENQIYSGRDGECPRSFSGHAESVRCAAVHRRFSR